MPCWASSCWRASREDDESGWCYITFDPAIDDQSEEFAKVYYRSDEDFADLLARLGERHQRRHLIRWQSCAPPLTRTKRRAGAWRGGGALSLLIGGRSCRAAEHTPGAALGPAPGDAAAEAGPGDVRDIARTWDVLRHDGLIGKRARARRALARRTEPAQFGKEQPEQCRRRDAHRRRDRAG